MDNLLPRAATGESSGMVGAGLSCPSQGPSSQLLLQKRLSLQPGRRAGNRCLSINTQDVSRKRKYSSTGESGGPPLNTWYTITNHSKDTIYNKGYNYKPGGCGQESVGFINRLLDLPLQLEKSQGHLGGQSVVWHAPACQQYTCALLWPLSVLSSQSAHIKAVI